ncbi:unnamed protein product [Cuscuta europaea]|uniref:Uncharacterized protein n=1 Tax=Cuscuta europaea TaxID=41803 RepID=A0A9P1EKX2_CUSEU|nr:unnamed protein product [Cuscuta europaea]
MIWLCSGKKPIYWTVLCEVLAGIVQIFAAKSQYDSVKHAANTKVRSSSDCSDQVNGGIILLLFAVACMIVFAQLYATIYAFIVAGCCDSNHSIEDVHKLMKAYARVYLLVSWYVPTHIRSM